MTMLFPSTYPSSRSACSKAATWPLIYSAEGVARNPIRGIFIAGCASAARGIHSRLQAKMKRKDRHHSIIRRFLGISSSAHCPAVQLNFDRPAYPAAYDDGSSTCRLHNAYRALLMALMPSSLYPGVSVCRLPELAARDRLTGRGLCIPSALKFRAAAVLG